MSSLVIDKFKVNLSNLDKVFWPKHNYTKGDMIDYYINIYPYMKNYLKNRPVSLKIYPDGIGGKYFFQKNAPDYAPYWLTVNAIYSQHRKEPINWILINKLSDLVWVTNKASIELHSWFSTVKNLEKPSFAVFDLDPDDKSSFTNVIQVALNIKKVLEELRLDSYIKTSGKSGLHIYLPLQEKYSYTAVKIFLKSVSEVVIKMNPDLATIEWRKKNREGKVYIDYRQNGQGKTLPAPYTLRPTTEATVSTPLNWQELNSDVSPDDFTIKNIQQRLQDKGDIWADLLSNKQELPDFFL
ncbi:MAG: non-homologous end-joining DNA ligase [Halothermotrichaceae bacterium]